MVSGWQFPDKIACGNTVAFLANPAPYRLRPILIECIRSDLGLRLLTDQPRPALVIQMKSLGSVWKNCSANPPHRQSVFVNEITLIQLPYCMVLRQNWHAPQQPHPFNFQPSLHADFPADVPAKQDHCAMKSARTNFWLTFACKFLSASAMTSGTFDQYSN